MNIVTLQSRAPNEPRMLITRDPYSDQWVDVYKVGGLPEIPNATPITVNLARVLKRPIAFLGPIAFAHRFELRHTGGKYIIPGPTGNFPRDFYADTYYDDDVHTHIFVAPKSLAANAEIVWVARARAYSAQPGDFYIETGAPGCLTVQLFLSKVSQ